MRSAFKALEHIEKLNEFKQDTLQGAAPVSKETILNRFKSCGIPSNEAFWSQFLASGLLVKVEGNLYVWKTKHPIHHQKLEGIYLRYQSKMKGYMSSYKQNLEARKLKREQEIQYHINFLKSLGYEIYAPVGEYFKKL